jgi:hypothetical protein
MALYKAIYDSGYDPRRVDQQHHHLNKVDDEIVAEIRRSRFLVADFTCEPGKVRGGVYFEAGFARGLNIPIIWTCRDTSPGRSGTVACLTAINPSRSLTLSWNEF